MLFRIAQTIGAAFLFSNSAAIITDSFADHGLTLGNQISLRVRRVERRPIRQVGLVQKRPIFVDNIFKINRVLRKEYTIEGRLIIPVFCYPK